MLLSFRLQCTRHIMRLRELIKRRQLHRDDNQTTTRQMAAVENVIFNALAHNTMRYQTDWVLLVVPGFLFCSRVLMNG